MIINTFKYILVSFSIILVFSSLSCDDRKVSALVTEDGLTLAFIEAQPVASGSTVGEAVVGYAGAFLIVELRDADGDPVKGGVISFNAKALEGYCGDQTPEATTEMRPCSLFNSASVRASAKLKYKPKIVDGKATRVEDVLHRFTFIMADDD